MAEECGFDYELGDMVTIARIDGATRIMGETQEEYLQLPIRDELIKGVNTMTSAWELSPKEIASIRAGAKLYVTILGTVHPPIIIKVERKP